MTERWLPAPGFDGYEVSSLGRVRSLDREEPLLSRWGQMTVRRYKGRILSLGWTTNGYRKVNLSRETVLVHRLTCEAFHGPAPTPEHEVAHGDGDRANNVEVNLRWATTTENQADRKLHGTYTFGETHSAAKLNDQQVREIKSSVGKAALIAPRFGVSVGTVWRIRRGTAWGHVKAEAA